MKVNFQRILNKLAKLANCLNSNNYDAFIGKYSCLSKGINIKENITSNYSRYRKDRPRSELSRNYCWSFARIQYEIMISNSVFIGAVYRPTDSNYEL